MKLHKVIERLLIKSDHPMMVGDIITKIERDNIIVDDANKFSLNRDLILECVWKYESKFEYVNGLVFLRYSKKWEIINKVYLYLNESLRGIFPDSDIQFIVATLLFYKRLVDIQPNASSILSDNLSNSSWIESLEELESHKLAPNGVFKEVSSLLLKLNSSKQTEILLTLKVFDSSSFSKLEFGSIYEYLLYQNPRESLKFEHSTPDGVRNILAELIGLIDQDKVLYDPVAGLGGSLSKLFILNRSSIKLNINGSEINKRTALLGNMVLVMYGYNNDCIRAEDCFENIKNSIKFDYIVGDIPIDGVVNSIEHDMLYEQFRIQPPKSRQNKRFNSLVLFSYSKLSATGKAVVTVSENFLTKGGLDEKIRELLLHDDVIETIISLPKGIYRPYTESKASILVINNSKPKYLEHKIKFIQGNILAEDRKSLLLDVDQLISAYKDDSPRGKYSQIVNIKELASGNNLSAEIYNNQFYITKEMLKDGTARLLKNIAEIRLGIQPKREEISSIGVPIIKIENLNKDVIDINLDVRPITTRIENPIRFNKNIIYQDCVLIARIGESLKPTIYKSNSEPILLHSNVMALIPTTETDLNYLYYQLNSSFINKQLETRKGGVLIPFLNRKDIEEIIIPYDNNIEVQKRTVNTQKVNLIAEESRRLEEKKKVLGYIEESKDAEINIVRTITHQLRHNLSTITAFSEKIKEIISKYNIGDLKEYEEEAPILKREEGFDKPENYSLKEAIDKVFNKSSFLSKVLIDVESAITLNLDYSEGYIYDILKELKDEYREILIDIKGDIDQTIEMSKTHIKDMFDTLVKNAIQHGGIDKSKLKINFIIKQDNKTIKIEYRNNGKPIEINQVEFESMLTSSRKSTGSGVGGFYIKKIIEAHNGQLRIEDELNLGVKMIIELPLKHNIYE